VVIKSSETHDFEVLKSTNMSLAKEVSILKEELAVNEQELSKKDKEIDLS
jgi:hypothetical protein